ncbi:Ankyrin repeat and BTB/POZ domain-containing protein 1, partial [Gonapodya sp. JEL0774]
MATQRFTAALKAADHPQFVALVSAVKAGDIHTCKKLVEEHDVPINQRDQWDATPLYWAAFCGRKEVVEFLLERGAVCDPTTFEGERAIYGALTDEIRNMLRSHQYSNKMVDGLHDYELGDGHRGEPFSESSSILPAHRFVLARSSYLAAMMATTWWGIRDVRVSRKVPPLLFHATVRYLYTSVFDPEAVPDPLLSDWLRVAITWRLPSLASAIRSHMADRATADAEIPEVVRAFRRAKALTKRRDIGAAIGEVRQGMVRYVVEAVETDFADIVNRNLDGAAVTDERLNDFGSTMTSVKVYHNGSNDLSS